MNDRAKPRQPAPPPGLCGTCRHAREIVSARGSRFLRCALSDVDPRYPRYPPLPVVACDGYVRVTPETPPDSGYD